MAKTEGMAAIILGIAVCAACSPGSEDARARRGSDAAETAALRAAVEADHVAEAEAAISAGADVNARFQLDRFEAYWTTPLAIAAGRGDVEMVRRLLSSGADSNLWTSGSGSPLSAVLGRNALDVAALLIERGAGIDAHPSNARGAFTMLMLAVKDGRTEQVLFLIDHGADVNAMNRSGATALMIAAEIDFAEAAELLIANGASVQARHESSGAAALFFGYANLSLEVGKVLLGTVRIATS